MPDPGPAAQATHGGAVKFHDNMQKNEKLQAEVDEAVRVLRAGGVILYPTDTVWGLGCDATNAEAVARIYALKRRHRR